MEGIKITPEEKVKFVKEVLEKMGFTRPGTITILKKMKREAVKKYLTTDSSLHDICREYKLRSISQVQKWITDTKNQAS